MAFQKPPYPAEFRQQIVELVAAGRTPAELAKEFGCSAPSIAKWVSKAAVEPDAPTAKNQVVSPAERQELDRLRRENRQLKIERDILSKATAWFANKSEKTNTGSSN